MPKKGKGKGGPAYDTSEETLRSLGYCRVNDMVVTPLGVQVVILGAKPDSEGTMRLWAQYPGELVSPLEPKTPEEFQEMGYRRAHEALHILRNKELNEERRQEQLSNVEWEELLPANMEVGESTLPSMSTANVTVVSEPSAASPPSSPPGY
mmetsp:Transcript_895/g.2068  ORF Transcript_895/g.2068 Transcript_895/m.2068 type:complete len:151 (-) Transcript_895:237-689(-)|eukprot:CAMPEP_0196721808 /NCGR_PEP_ID=MMETSP1091-20130531/4285_1 /TAXON_ID=302021 /ORGANISM="Rhodomonas sp., Strain CCMP768" /LENGTH=150 /DNA_ID=CAMNT_0042063375 /DNA_START=71 /DNA_END=523 /DNA_ORIENTATION=-